jgi:secondary thiamine-phosphate synthase enzyme
MLELKLSTSKRSEFIDITDEVQKVISKSGIKQGVCEVFVPHTTAGITINENADPDVVADIINNLERLVPWRNSYAHSEGNSAAHIKASMMGFSQSVIIADSQLMLGTWQGIYFCEFDGPRQRKVWVRIV